MIYNVIYDLTHNFHYLVEKYLYYLLGKYRDLPALLLLPCVAVAWHFLATRIGQFARWLAILAVILASGIVLMMVWTSGSYLAAPGYFDHVEPSIAAISWWYRHGHPLYPAWNEDEGLYGLVYGPLLFQITAAALTLSPTILMSKIPGFCCFWLAGMAIMGSLRPLLPSARLSLLPLAACLIIAGSYWNWAYWDRSDPYLLLAAALALCSSRRMGRTNAAIAVGLLGGISVNLKVHGALYVLPYAVALLARESSRAAQLRTAVIGITSSLPAIVLPFLDPDVSLSHYIAYIQNASRHGMDEPLLLANLRFAGVLLTPFLFLAWRRLRGEPQPDLPMGLAYLVSVLAVCVIGAKPGAGPHHLLPFLPAFAFFLVRAAQLVRIPGKEEAEVGGLAAYFLAISVSYMPSFAISLDEIYSRGHGDEDRAELHEIRQLYTAHPAAIMGVGGDVSYPRTVYRVVGIFAGAPIGIDMVAWMDLQFGGVSDEAVERLLIGCHAPLWIIPKGGAPFTLISLYRRMPLFSDRFRELFLKEYVPIHDGTFYSVWACRDYRPNRLDQR